MDSFSLTKTTIEWIEGSVRVFYNQEVIARLEYTATAQIAWIWVQPEYRRKKVARLMLAEVERRTGLIAHPLPPVSTLGWELFK